MFLEVFQSRKVDILSITGNKVSLAFTVKFAAPTTYMSQKNKIALSTLLNNKKNTTIHPFTIKWLIKSTK